MNKQTKWLITACVIITILLLGIQFYFLKNTYDLYKRQTLTEIQNIVNIIEEDSLKIDTLRRGLVSKAEQLFAKLEDKNNLERQLLNNYDSQATEKAFNLIAANSLLKKHRVEYFVQIIIAEFRFENDPGHPIIFHNLPWIGRPNTMGSEAFDISGQSREIKNSKYGVVHCLYRTRSSFKVNDWQSGLLSKLVGLIIFSSFLMLGVVALFYYSIKNIIKQKKIADLKTDFVNNITHEFNTPLTALDVAAATLKKLERNMSNEASDAVSTIERQSKRLNVLVKQALEFSMANSEIEVQRSFVEMGEFVSGVVSDFERSYPGIAISMKQEAGAYKMSIDPVMMTTAINNLLNNAIKYGGSKIEISTSVNGNAFFISVKDNGIGIHPGKAKLIFDKFFRGESGDTHNTKGLGLGLYYAKQILEAHKGKIEVQSRIGAGSTFILSIPLV